MDGPVEEDLISGLATKLLDYVDAVLRGAPGVSICFGVWETEYFIPLVLNGAMSGDRSDISALLLNVLLGDPKPTPSNTPQ